MLVLLGLSSMLATSTGLRLLCDFSFTSQGDLGSIYTCAARLVFAGDTRNVTELDGIHAEGQDNRNVEALLYNQQDIGFTPRNISWFFPNLIWLNADTINSPELGREHLEGLQSLRTLRFGNNKLREIEYDLFIDNPLLTAIYFEYNPIRHVAHNAFDHLSGLRILLMYENACINELANNRGDVETLLFQILLECPPTFRMIEERIINGSELNNKIQSQIYSDLDIMHTRLKAIEEQQSTLAQRVEALEQNRPLTSQIGN